MGEPSSSSHASASTVCVVFYDEEGDPDSDFLEEHLLPGYMVITKRQNWIVRATCLHMADHPFEALNYDCPFCGREHRHCVGRDVYYLARSEVGGCLLCDDGARMCACVSRDADREALERLSHKDGVKDRVH